MTIECFAGETVRITAANLTHASTGAVTTGTPVTITLYTPAGAIASGPHTAVNSGSSDDWYFDLTAPATAGQYLVRIEAVSGGATAKDKLYLTVKTF